MEIYDVVGFKKVDFKDKDGKQIKGFSLHLARPFDADNAAGTEVRKEFISSQYVSYVPSVGDHVKLIYNRYGKISAIETC